MYNKDLFFNEKSRKDIFENIFEFVALNKYDKFYNIKLTDLQNLIDRYYQTNNIEFIFCTIEIIFWHAGQGQRPWCIEAEKAFAATTQIGTDLILKLRNTMSIPIPFYVSIIEKLNSLNIYSELIHLEKLLESNNITDREIGRYTQTINCFENILNNHSICGVSFLKDYPSEILVFVKKNLIIQFFEFVSDSDLKELFSILARTRSQKAKEILSFYLNDDEENIRQTIALLMHQFN